MTLNKSPLTAISQSFASKTDPGVFPVVPVAAKPISFHTTEVDENNALFRGAITGFLGGTTALSFCPVCFTYAGVQHTSSCPLANKNIHELDRFPCGVIDDISGIEHRCDSAFDSVKDRLQHVLDFHPTVPGGKPITRELAENHWRPEHPNPISQFLHSNPTVVQPLSPSLRPIEPSTINEGRKVVRRSRPTKANDHRFKPAVHAARKPEHSRRVVRR